MLTANEMVLRLEQALMGGAGIAEISVDGQRVKYDRAQLLTELDYWKKRADREAGKRPLFKGFDLSTAW